MTVKGYKQQMKEEEKTPRAGFEPVTARSFLFFSTRSGAHFFEWKSHSRNQAPLRPPERRVGARAQPQRARILPSAGLSDPCVMSGKRAGGPAWAHWRSKKDAQNRTLSCNSLCFCISFFRSRGSRRRIAAPCTKRMRACVEHYTHEPRWQRPHHAGDGAT